MENFFEAVLEVVFGLAKDKPDKMPDIEYMDDFVVKHPIKKTFMRICATLVVIVVFSLLWIFIKNEAKYLFAVFVVLGVILFILSFISFSFKCSVNEERLHRSYLCMFKREIRWEDIICVRTVEQENEKTIVIALYDHKGKKCVIDFNTDMQNAWYIVKMAERKGIEIRNEKDLTLRQISKLED